MNQQDGTKRALMTWDGKTCLLNGTTGLEFITAGSRGAEMRDRLVRNMPGLILASQTVEMGTYALSALRDIPATLAEYGQAWSTAGAIAEEILNGPLDPEGEEQEQFHARLNPEGASPDCQICVAHDPDAFIISENSDMQTLDWWRTMRETLPSWKSETENYDWSKLEIGICPPENEG